jgi:hypothetical protein
LKKPRIVIKSEDERLVYGEVYAPMRVDTDTEAMTAAEIKKMAHSFLANGLTDKVDVSHNFEESGAAVVESFIARKDDPDGFIESSWVVGAHIPEHLWEAVKSGEINGFSFAGLPCNKTTARAQVRMVKKLVGETEPSTEGPLPPHDHSIALVFNDGGRIIPTLTGESLGHSHEVTKATATSASFDHSHRMILIENDEGR